MENSLKDGRRRALITTAGFTASEWKVARLFPEGHSSAEMAKVLCKSIKTVEAHTASIYKKVAHLFAPKVPNRVRVALWVKDQPEYAAKEGACPS